MYMKQEAFPTSMHWKCSDAERTSELETGKLGRHIPPGTFYNLAARRIYQRHFYDSTFAVFYEGTSSVPAS